VDEAASLYDTLCGRDGRQAAFWEISQLPFTGFTKM